jgi:NTP pyrophosphatase (non-canonical NTP hydrolase)
MERLKQVADKYGKQNQVVQSISELAELIKALTDDALLRDKRVHIAEEIADVLIMIYQLRYIFDIDELVDDIISHKIADILKTL